MNEYARHTIADLLQKAYVLDKRDTAKKIICFHTRKICPIDLLIESWMGITKKMYNTSYLSSVIIH